CLFEFGNAHDLATHLRKLLADPDLRQRLRRKAYDYGRSMIWSEVGRQYVSALEQATQQHLEQLRVLGASNKLLMSMSLPKVQLQHLSIMTDGTGIFQHSVYSTPNRHHGYSTDDNTRALIVTSMRWFLFHDNSVLRHQQTYLSFLHYAWSKRLGRFRNFLTFERSWRDATGGDDCQGRALWALGYVVAHAPNQSVQSLAEELFLAAMPESGSLRHPRGQAFAILGLNYYFRQHPENRAADELFRLLAAKLSQSFAGHATKEWPWFEDIVTYENGRLPQALIIAGHQHQNEDLLQLGFRTLRWLLDAQSSPAGHLSIIGNDGWLHRGKEPARFDQQPVESAALIGACKAAYRASNNPQWLVEMRRCFEWFLGKNDGGVALIDFKTHGCHDGLTATGVNMNQGAESVLSWLLSLLTMHEMQTGDAPEIT
ncbi:MAG: glycosyl transferase family 1, partial [Planctomycetota bacterium]